MRIIMTALAPLECCHPRLGQSLWRLGVMRPQCLHAHAAPAGVLVCPAGRPGEVPLPSVALPLRAGGGAGSGRRAPLVCVPSPSPACASRASWGLGVVPPPPPWSPLAGSARPQAAQWGGGSPRGRGAHRRHPRVPLVPSGTTVPYSPVCQRARSARWVSMCLAHPRLSPPLVCLRPVLPCARVLWCEAYGVWLLAPILWPRVHHLKGGAPPAIRYCGLRIEVRAVVQLRALGPSFCRLLSPASFSLHRLLSAGAAGLRCGLVPCALSRLAFFCACLDRCLCAHLSSPYVLSRCVCVCVCEADSVQGTVCGVGGCVHVRMHTPAHYCTPLPQTHCVKKPREPTHCKYTGKQAATGHNKS